MKKKILTYPEDQAILSQKSQEVDYSKDKEEILQIIEDLKDTLESEDNGCGISAIQIGIPKRICLCYWGGKKLVLINPVITRSRGKQLFLEGCLSAPGKMKEVSRFQKVWCNFLNENGESMQIADGGRMSDIIQHELDHFEGRCQLIEEEGE